MCGGRLRVFFLGVVVVQIVVIIVIELVGIIVVVVVIIVVLFFFEVVDEFLVLVVTLGEEDQRFVYRGQFQEFHLRTLPVLAPGDVAERVERDEPANRRQYTFRPGQVNGFSPRKRKRRPGGAAWTRLAMAGLTGLEPATSCVTGRRSNQLNYNPPETSTGAEAPALTPHRIRARSGESSARWTPGDRAPYPAAMGEPSSEYEPRDFWQKRLAGQFDLRGTGHPGLSARYNARCYDLRAHVLDRALARHEVPVAGRRVLDAGCGTGFLVEHFLALGARVTGVDLTDVSVSELSRRFPEARFEVGDLAEWRPSSTWDLVSCFDVLFHIVDDERWDRALTNLADAVAPGGWFVFTEIFPRRRRAFARAAAHNVTRGWDAYRPALHARGLSIVEEVPTHHLLNNDLGVFRFLNRFPDLLYRVDLALLITGLLETRGANRLVLCRRPEAGRAGASPVPRAAAR